MDKEAKVLELNKAGLSQHKIADEIKISKSSVNRILKKNNVKTRTWTKEEEEYLKNGYGEYSFKGIARRLGRGVNSVKRKAERMGLGPVLEYSECLTAAELGRAFKMSDINVKDSWINKYNLKTSFKVLAKERKFHQINIEEFWKWAKEHKDIIDFSKLDEGYLGEEPEWVIEQRKKDFKRVDRNSHKQWTNDEDKLLQMYWSSGRTCKEIGKILKRSEASIWRRTDVLCLERRQIKIPWSQKEINIITQLRNKGYSYARIGNEIGRSERSVRLKIIELSKNEIQSNRNV